MNTKLTLTSVLISATLLASSSIMAEGWSGKASVGAVMTSGNSDTKNVNGSANLINDSAVWKQNAFGSIYSSESNDVETANRFELGYKVSRKFRNNLYAFGRIRYDTDDYGNIDKRVSGVVGLGKTFIDSPKQKLGAELGVGSARVKYITLNPVLTSAGVVDTTQTPLDSIEDNGRMIYGGLNYRRALNNKLSFNSVLSVEAAENNTNIVWDNSLGVKLTERFSLSLGVLTRNDSDIVGQLGEDTDTTTRFNVVYGF